MSSFVRSVECLQERCFVVEGVQVEDDVGIVAVRHKSNPTSGSGVTADAVEGAVEVQHPGGHDEERSDETPVGQSDAPRRIDDKYNVHGILTDCNNHKRRPRMKPPPHPLTADVSTSAVKGQHFSNENSKSIK